MRIRVTGSVALAWVASINLVPSMSGIFKELDAAVYMEEKPEDQRGQVMPPKSHCGLEFGPQIRAPKRGAEHRAVRLKLHQGH